MPGFAAERKIRYASRPGPHPAALRALRVLAGSVLGIGSLMGQVPPPPGMNSTLVTLNPNAQPNALAVNLATNQIYATDPGNACLWIVDGTGRNPPRSVSVGASPAGVAVDPATDTVYVTDSVQGLYVLDGANPVPVSPVKVGSGLGQVLVNAATHRACVVSNGDQSIYLIGGQGNPVQVPLAGAPTALACNPAANAIYVATAAAPDPHPSYPAVSAFDGTSGMPTGTLDLGSFAASALTVNAVSGLVYAAVAGSGLNQIWVHDFSGTVADTRIPLSFRPTARLTLTTSNQIFALDGTGGQYQWAQVNGADQTLVGTNGTYSGLFMENTLGLALDPLNAFAFFLTGPVSGNDLVHPVQTSPVGFTLFNPIAPGAFPASNAPGSTLAMNPVSGRLYAANPGSGSILVLDAAQNQTTAVTQNVGAAPAAVVFNPVSGAFFVDNGDGTVSTAQGGNSPQVSPGPLTVGTGPAAMAVNTLTNRVYVGNQGTPSVFVLDGAGGTVLATVTGLPGYPAALAVNPLTNQTFVAEPAQDVNGFLSIIGANNAHTDVPLVPPAATAQPVFPNDVGVNPFTNQVYVVDGANGCVHVIDANNPSAPATTLQAGFTPRALAVDPVRNLIWVTDYKAGTVTVLDGALLAPTVTISLDGDTPAAIALDPERGRVYVAGSSNSTVYVLDGGNPGPAALLNAVAVPVTPGGFALDPARNRIYVLPDYGGSIVSVLDGANLGALVGQIPVPGPPGGMAVDPVHHQVAVSVPGTPAVTFIDADSEGTLTLPVALDATLDNPDTTVTTALPATPDHSPTFSVAVTSGYRLGYTNAQAEPVPATLYSRTDDLSSGPWSPGPITGSGTAGSCNAANLASGFHLLYLFSGFGAEAAPGACDTSKAQALPFFVTPAPATLALTASANPQATGAAVTFTATVVPGPGGTATPSGLVYFYEGPTLLAPPVPLSGNAAGLTLPNLASGLHALSAIFAGDPVYAITTGTLTERIGGPATLVVVSGGGQEGPVGTDLGQPLVLQVDDPGGNPLSGITVTFAGSGLQLSAPSAVTDSAGQVSVTLTPGAVGAGTATATVAELAPLTVGETGLGLSPTVTLTASASTVQAETPVTLTATLAGAGGTPTGDVTFYDGTTALATVASSGGTATFTTALLASGDHGLSAASAGDSLYLPAASATVDLQVEALGTVLTLTRSGADSYLGEPVTFRATVGPAASSQARPRAQAVPTGTVQFLQGTQVLASVPLAGGVATFTTTGLAEGADPVSASYGGDAFDAPCVSGAALVEQVEAPALILQTPPAAALTMPSVGTVSTSFVLACKGLPPAPATLALTGLPAALWSWTFSPGLVDLSGGARRVNLTITRRQPKPGPHPPLPVVPTGLGLGAVLGLALDRRRKRLGAWFCALALALGCTSCGTDRAPTVLASGSTFQATLTASAPGATPVSIPIRITVK